MRKWIIAVGIIALFCGIALIVNLVRLRHIAQDALTREEIEGMIAKQTTPIVKEVIVREKVYVNSSQPELRSAWRTLRSVAPTGPVSLLYALRLELWKKDATWKGWSKDIRSSLMTRNPSTVRSPNSSIAANG